MAISAAFEGCLHTSARLGLYASLFEEEEAPIKSNGECGCGYIV